MRIGPRSVRRLVTAVVALTAAVTGFLTVPAATVASAAGGHPIAFGADLKAAKGQTVQQAITKFETTTGRTLAFTRDYLLWDSPFPTDYEQWLAARGTVPFISVSPHTMANATISWASIANAQPGDPVYTQMAAWADKVKAFGYPVYFTFNHEPEAAASLRYGGNTDFIAAWQNFHRVFDAEGVTNARWIWTMTAYAFTVKSNDRRWGPYWYPGDAYVDALGADAYTAYTCDNPSGIWHSLAYQIAGFTGFGAQHPSKPLWLPEWGVVEDPAQPGRKAQFITDAEALFKTSPYQQYAGIAYFNETRPGTACVWDVSSSSSSQAAYNAMAGDSFYSGSAAYGSDTTAPTVAITTPADGDVISGTTTIGATAGDDTAVQSVAFSVDGHLLSTATSPPYSAVVDASTLTAGSHALTAFATDTAGNTTTSAPVNVTTAGSPPPPPPPPPPSQCAAAPTGSSELSGNVSLETNQTGWTGVYNSASQTSRVQVSGGSYDGGWALKVSPKGSATGIAGVNNVSPYWVPGSPGAATVAGRPYTGSAAVRSSVANLPVTLLLRETTTGGGGVSYASKTVTLPDTQWHQLSVTYQARNAGDQIRYSLYAKFPSSGTTLLGDCLSLQSTP